VQRWINFWINVVKVDPHVFTHLVAIGETAVAIIYVLVFAGLFLAFAGLYWGVDRYLAPLLGRFKFLASGASDLPARKQIVPASSLKS
jgi:hypothetical protein